MRITKHGELPDRPWEGFGNGLERFLKGVGRKEAGVGLLRGREGVRVALPSSPLTSKADDVEIRALSAWAERTADGHEEMPETALGKGTKN